MAYTLDYAISLGSNQTGLTLAAQLVDTDGANTGSEITAGFTEIGDGNYHWHYASFPDAHRGGVKFYESGVPGVILAFASINPEESEHTAAILADTNELQTDLTDGGRLDLILDKINADTDAAKTFYQVGVHVERKATVDEYTVAVLQNGQLFTGSITSCSVAMVKRADGTELFSATAMTAVDDGLYKLDKTATRTAADTGYIAVVTVVIAGVTYILAAPVHTSA